MKKKAEKIKVPVEKPTNKGLNDALLSKKSGAHYSAKFDYDRAKEKSKHRKELKDQDWRE
jgi:hypothetical protein